jgi:hypothetical protein
MTAGTGINYEDGLAPSIGSQRTDSINLPNSARMCKQVCAIPHNQFDDFILKMEL